ncbi:phosphotransferase [Plantibacter flavus]|uniref:aminoglycoside phosphotransferase family protein n=1 Tax=Plantibacter flavus TaxID=150123 RepID=UPI003F1861ED
MAWRPGSIDEAVRRWALVPDGEAFSTASSTLLPVRHDGRRAMLKVPRVEEESLGGRLLAAWGGVATAAVFEVDEQAIVLERAEPGQDLSRLTRDGDDSAAVAIICSVLDTLHSARPADQVVRELPTLRRWFRDLETAAGRMQGEHLTDASTATQAFLVRAWTIAARLLSTAELPQHAGDTVVLHGDLHHQNVLEFAPGDWRAVDPKGIVGHRAFDHLVLFGNPDPATAHDEAVFARRLATVSALSGLAERTLLEWLVAWSALSATWSLQDGDQGAATDVLAVGALAERALGERALAEQDS